MIQIQMRIQIQIQIRIKIQILYKYLGGNLWVSLIQVKDDTKSDADTNTNTRNIIEIPWWQSLGEPYPGER